MKYLALAPVRYFHPDGDGPTLENCECSWCEMPIDEYDQGYEILVKGSSNTYELQSIYHIECWSARWVDGIQASAPVQDAVRTLYQMHYHAYLSGGCQPSEGMIEQLQAAGGPEPGKSSRLNPSA